MNAQHLHREAMKQAAPRTCTHSWHNDPTDGLPVCKGDECSGKNVACGQGLIDCPRHPVASVKYVVILTGPQKALVERSLTDTVTGPNRREGIAAQPLLHGLLNLSPASESPLLAATVSDDLDDHQPLPFFVTVHLSTKQTLRFRTADDAIELYRSLIDSGYAATMDPSYYDAAQHYTRPAGIEG